MPENFTLADARRGLNVLADLAAEYAGLPMPLQDERLLVHPSYPYASVFNTKPVENDDFTVINRWPCQKLRGDVVIFLQDGKYTAGLSPWRHPADMQLHTLGVVSTAHEMGTEYRAVQKLKELVTPHAFHCYMMSGAFLETSPRSKITYVFRKLRPTLALSFATGATRVLCGLCLHPIGYYEGTWAGAMVPTDEVVAHLVLMRGDEHGFWKQANQHHPSRAESGL